MNYEELLELRQGENPRGVNTPIGTLARRQVDGQWRYELRLDSQFTEDSLFISALEQDEAATRLVNRPEQAKFSVERDSAGPYALLLPKGNYTTLEQYISEQPMALARKGYVEDTLQRLATLCDAVAKQGLHLVSMHPSLLLVRRKEGEVLALLHGSLYMGQGETTELMFGNIRDSIAPEVLGGSEPSDASDTYAMAWLAQWLYQSAEAPLGARAVLKKGLAIQPDKRPATPQTFVDNIRRRNGAAKQGLLLLAATLIAAAIVGFYFEMVPETEVVEFVKPNPVDSMAWVLEDTIFIPDDNLQPGQDTMDALMTPQERAWMKRYEKKAEEIFRKRYAKAADPILSSIYNDKSMASDQERFAATSLAGAERLDQLQKDLANEVGITDVRGQKLASDIIQEITKKKLEGLKGRASGATPGKEE